MAVIDWLLDSDPSIRWQVMRDLTDEPRRGRRGRARTRRDRGLGRAAARPPGAGRPVGRQGLARRTGPTRSTSWSSLRRLGLDPASERGAAGHRPRPRPRHVGRRRRFEPPWADNGFFEGEVEPCINGNVVATGAYFGVDMTPLVERLLGEQLSDGGWNCEVENGATVSSFGDDHQRPRGPARVRARDRRVGQGGGGPPPRRGVPAGAPAVSAGSPPAR